MTFKILTIIITIVASSCFLDLLQLPLTESKLNLNKPRFIHQELNSRATTSVPTGRGNEKPEDSLTLDPSVIQEASKTDGKDSKFFPSATSNNNFINFCATAAGKVNNAILMNGAQTKERPACNPIPMGMIASQDKIPACKFFSPKNLDKILEKKTFTVSVTVVNLIAGKFTNPQNTYYAAPAQLDPNGILLGHLHVVIHKIDRLDSTEILKPLGFQFFKGVDSGADKDGRVTVEVTGGLPVGFYRLATIMSAANHQPVGTTLAQRGSNDDMIYIAVVNQANLAGKNP